jgi:tetraacyldisaccharide 4'-kinase
MDDGFQHRQLQRDLDVVLIDATRDTFHDDLLPAGHLREPLETLKRADAVIVTRSGTVDEGLTQQIERWHGKPPIAWARHAWPQLWIKYSDPRMEPEPVSWLRGKRIVTLLGTGNPHSILEQVEAAGAKVMANVPAGDHEHYDRAKLIAARDLCDGSEGLFMTRKDWVKVGPLLARGRVGQWHVPIIIPQVDIEFIAGEDALRQMLLRAVPHGCRDG